MNEETPRKRTGHRWVAGGLLLALLGGGLWFCPPHTWSKFKMPAGLEKRFAAMRSAQDLGAPPVEPIMVRTQIVTTTADIQTHVYSGEVRGRYESPVAFQTGGRITRRRVQLGDRVQAGDVLMELDPKDLQEAVQLGVAQLKAAEAQRDLAETSVQRCRRLFEKNAIPRAQLDQAEAGYASAKAVCDQAAAGVTLHRNQLDYATLRAPEAGVVAHLTAEEGQVVGPGLPVLILIRDGEREIEINVPEQQREVVQNATSMTATFWALPGCEVAGRLRELAPMADPAIRTFKARVSLASTPEKVELGMTASVRVTTQSATRRVVVLPLSALYRDDDVPNVWVVKDHVAQLRPVELEGFEGDQLRVVNGLADGELVVTAGVHKLRNGQQVRVLGESK